METFANLIFLNLKMKHVIMYKHNITGRNTIRRWFPLGAPVSSTSKTDIDPFNLGKGTQACSE